jgi:hypothetical protein
MADAHGAASSSGGRGLEAATAGKTRYGTDESSREVAAAAAVGEVVVAAAATRGSRIEAAMAGKTRGGVDRKTRGVAAAAAAEKVVGAGVADGGDQAAVSLCLEGKLAWLWL